MKEYTLVRPILFATESSIKISAVVLMLMFRIKDQSRKRIVTTLRVSAPVYIHPHLE